MKFNGYRKQLTNPTDTSAYDNGYTQGQKDLFIPMAVVGIVCCVLGWILAMAM